MRIMILAHNYHCEVCLFFSDTWRFLVVILELRAWIPLLKTINTIIASET